MVEVVRRNGGFIKSDVSEGPQRWERARLNAERHPNSSGAKLYRKRVEVAAFVTSEVRGSVPLVFVNDPYAVEGGPRHGRGTVRRRYVCSTRCAAMRWQLDNKEATADEIVAGLRATLEGEFGAVRVNHWTHYTARKVDLSLLEREVGCRVCGATIAPDVVTVAAIAKTTADHDQFILVDGQLRRVSELQTVDLTERDLYLLTNYSTPQLRADYMADHGRRITL